MKKIFLLFLLLFCLIANAIVVNAHPGRTDSNGGHYDNSTGAYHYHHGYPAHQHTNGKCRYNYKDMTSSTVSKAKLSDGKDEIIVEIISIVTCIILMTCGQDIHDFIKSKFKKK